LLVEGISHVQGEAVLEARDAPGFVIIALVGWGRRLAINRVLVGLAVVARRTKEGAVALGANTRGLAGAAGG
jgi:hypothetical protein